MEGKVCGEVRRWRGGCWGGEEVLEGELLGEVRRLNQPRIGGRDREGSRWGTDEEGGERRKLRPKMFP